MNHRLLELMGWANKYAWTAVERKYNEDGALNWEWEEAKLAKFAELIVEDCAQKVEHILRDKRLGGGTYADEIKEHFGFGQDSLQAARLRVAQSGNPTLEELREKFGDWPTPEVSGRVDRK